MTAVRPGIGPAGHPIRGLARVLANQPDGSGWRLVLEVPGWPGARPGQFVMLGAGSMSAIARHDPLLPRPMAVYRDGAAVGDAARRVEILYRVVGRGTALLAECAPEQRVAILGPLGCGFPIEPGHAPGLLVGGGTGIASLYGLAVALRDAGRGVHVALGARSAADLIGRRDFETLDETALALVTEDGSLGRSGLVTAPLEEWLREHGETATVYACGPTPMMRACAALAADHGARCLVSLENPMACGFGVCLGCAVPRRDGGFALVCRAGPVFEAAEIAWEGLP